MSTLDRQCFAASNVCSSAFANLLKPADDRTHRRRYLCAIALAAASCKLCAQNLPDTPPWRLLKASEAEQIAAVNATLDRGLPPDNDIGMLANTKSSLVLPLVEARIECALRSSPPQPCFPGTEVDSRRFVDVAALMIASVGDEQALEQVAKLVSLEPARFSLLIGRTLDHSTKYSKSHNPFVVAYSGFSIRNHPIDKLIVAWAEKNLTVDPEERARAEKAARGFGPPTPSPARKMKYLWAEAILERYGVAPTDAQWVSDPIASGLSRPLAASVHGEMPELIGSAQAEGEMSKIIQLDGHWSNYPLPGENPFGVAYSGLAIGNPSTQDLIHAWTEKHLAADAVTMKHVWADAVLTRYGGIPTDAQWAVDPIASSLSWLLAQSLHREISQLVNEALKERASK